MLIELTRVTPRRLPTPDEPIRTVVGVVLAVEDGQRPAPAGQLARDRSVGDYRTFLAGVEADPAGVQAVISGMPAGTGSRAGGLPAARRSGWGHTGRGDARRPRPAGGGHECCRSWSARPEREYCRGVHGGHQPQVGADRAPGQPAPVPDLDGNPNAVNVETPRRHPNRCTTGVNSLSAANPTIASSRRSRRCTQQIMASNAAS